VVNPTHRPPLRARKYSRYSFLLDPQSQPGPQCDRKDDTIGNQTCGLPACSAVPQLSVPQRAPDFTVYLSLNEDYERLNMDFE
jgi:hypothetical protein